MQSARPLAAALIAAAALFIAQPAAAQTIYPLTRAEILAGSKFDFKVEFEGAAPADIKVSINGRDPAEVFGKSPSVQANEDGQAYTAYWLRDVALTKPGSLRGDGVRRRQVADGQVGGVRHAAAARAQRDPVCRRRPVDGPPHGGAHAVEGAGGGALRRRAGDRRHAGHGAGLHLGHRFHRHGFGQLDERLHHRTQVLHQRPGRLLRAQQGWAGASARRDHRRARQAPARRLGRRRGDQHRDRGRHARGHGGARAPPQRLRRDRAHVLRGEAGRDDGRRLRLLPAQVGRGRAAQGRGELPREVQGGRLPVRRHGNRDENGRGRQGDDAPARPFPPRQSRRGARPQRAQEGHGGEVSRPARPRRPDAGGDRHSLQGAERVRADGGIGHDRQVLACAGLGARGVRHHHARQRRGRRQALCGASATIP